MGLQIKINFFLVRSLRGSGRNDEHSLYSSDFDASCVPFPFRKSIYIFHLPENTQIGKCKTVDPVCPMYGKSGEPYQGRTYTQRVLQSSHSSQNPSALPYRHISLLVSGLLRFDMQGKEHNPIRELRKSEYA